MEAPKNVWLEYLVLILFYCMDKKLKKIIDGNCYLCGESEYSTLDVHRIKEGAQGGKYTESNTVTCCACCHRKVHADLIKIDRWYYSTEGRVLHYWDEDGVEHFC